MKFVSNETKNVNYHANWFGQQQHLDLILFYFILMK